jgi:hypothetical protein
MGKLFGVALHNAYCNAHMPGSGGWLPPILPYPTPVSAYVVGTEAIFAARRSGRDGLGLARLLLAQSVSCGAPDER